MYKKIFALIILILLVAGVIAYKYYYPLSQWQLKNSFMHMQNMPSEAYDNANEVTCGIWYESYQSDDQVIKGRSNDSVLHCFQEAFEKCKSTSIYFVQDKSVTEQSITYSLVKILRSNDANECIIQNFYEKQELEVQQDEEMLPLAYINTCTKLSDPIFDSCQPLYIKQAIDKRTKIIKEFEFEKRKAEIEREDEEKRKAAKEKSESDDSGGLSENGNSNNEENNIEENEQPEA